MSKPYILSLPFAGHFHVSIESAESEEDALQQAQELVGVFTMCIRDSEGRAGHEVSDERGWAECAEWATYERFTEGNVVLVSENRVDIQVDKDRLAERAEEE